MTRHPYALALAMLATVACQTPEPVDTGVVPPPEPPMVSDLDVEQENYVAELTFSVHDLDDDLDGGSLRVQFGHDVQTWEIGSDVHLSGSSLRIEQAYSPCDTDSLVDVEATLTDASGLRSTVYTDSFLLAGDVLYEHEPNDLAYYDNEYNPFSFEYGRAICGSMSSTGVDSSQTYTGDVDYYKVNPKVPGTWTVTLRAAQPSARFDVWTYADGAWQSHYAKADVVAFDMETWPGEEFYLGVMAGSGPSGQYAITFE